MMIVDLPRKRAFCLCKYLTSSGLKNAPYHADSLEHALHFEPSDGVYMVIQTFNNKVVHLCEQVNRLEQSAHRAGIEVHLNCERLRRALRSILEEAAWGDIRCRITVPRETPEILILSAEPFMPLSHRRSQQGVKCVTWSYAKAHREMPLVKSSRWLHQRQKMLKELPQDVHTALLLDHKGHILEGIDSNFFAIRKGSLWTAKEGILLGFSRKILLSFAEEILPVRFERVLKKELHLFEEAFITSGSRAILPVTQIDEVVIGDGAPGPLTMRLKERYLEEFEKYLEEL